MISECAQQYSSHVPVLKEEVLDLLNIHINGIYLDGTIGFGGHASAILSHLSNKGILVGLDGDVEALKHSKTVLSASSSICHLFHDSYDNFARHLESLGIREVDGIFLDLGLSSHQIDSPHRGFSYQVNGPLDMRFNTDSPLAASEMINQWDEGQLNELIWRFGEERQATRIAKAIVERRKTRSITTTFELRDVVSSVVQSRYLTKSLSRVFQAFRIGVNRELETLQNFLDSFIDYLKTGGRTIIISYHSLEDRLVKNKFKELARGCICSPEIPECRCGLKPVIKILTRTPLRPTEMEVRRNRRARSAKLRAVEKI